MPFCFLAGDLIPEISILLTEKSDKIHQIFTKKLYYLHIIKINFLKKGVDV